MKKSSAAAAILLLTCTSLTVGADKPPGHEEQVEPGAGMTVYLDISVMGRKKRAAKRMTELHEENFRKGWTVVDVEPYLENGDLQGFYMNYVGRQ